MLYKIVIAFSAVLLLTACGQNKSNSSTGSNSLTIRTAEKKSDNYLFMKINGKEWKADQNIFGAFHPSGYNKAILMAGDKGIADKDRQSFNINLYNTIGPAVFKIKDGNADNNVIQLTNVSEQDFLYGSMMGYNVKVNITKASSNPMEIEAAFAGELTGNAGDKLVITDGKFYYHE